MVSVLALPAFATSDKPAQPKRAQSGLIRGLGNMFGRKAGMRPEIVGIVSAINGNVLTISGRPGFGTTTPATATTFTVDATNAKIIKGNATSSIASIAVGDIVLVQGKISGANVTATLIRDGQMGKPGNGNGKGNRPATSSPIIAGNGQPVVAGVVGAISGSTLTITNKSNVSYTIDASSAKIWKGQNAISLTDLKVGDSVMVQGTVNGTAITASTVIDQTKPAGSSGKQPARPGFFGGIGNFFARLFGF